MTAPARPTRTEDLVHIRLKDFTEVIVRQVIQKQLF